MKNKAIFAAIFGVLWIAGCSPVMESMRPDPVDLSQFAVGEKRINVLSQIGAPLATTKNGRDSCDIYKLYTHGPSSVGKGAIAAGEAVADLLTLGLTEVITTPVEAATKDSKHTVVFCYTHNRKLAFVKEAKTAVTN